jgi:hypothetical protein
MCAHLKSGFIVRGDLMERTAKTIGRGQGVNVRWQDATARRGGDAPVASRAPIRFSTTFLSGDPSR